MMTYHVMFVHQLLSVDLCQKSEISADPCFCVKYNNHGTCFYS